MAGRDLTYTIGVDASDAAAGLRKLESSVRSTMRTVEDELDEGASAGDKLAESLDRVAAQAKEDLNSAAIAAQELQDALRRAGSGLEVGDALASLRRMGLSFDEITADADKLATSLRQLDDVRAAGVAELDTIAPGLATKLDDVSRSADSSKSALANMIGNSAQDLGELSGVAGSLGVAVGQMAEYFADAAFEGEGLGSVFRSFAGVAAPIAAIAIATKAVSDVMGRFSASSERSAESVQRWEDALRSGEDASSEYASALEDVGEVTLDVTRAQSKLQNVVAELDSSLWSTGIGVSLFNKLLGGSSEETKDMTDELVRAGVDVDRWTELVEGGAGALMTFREALQETNLSEEEQADLITTLTQAQEDHATASKNAGVMTQFFGSAAEEAAPSVEELARAQEEAVESARQQAIALSDANRSLLEVTSTFAEMGRRGDAIRAIFDLGNAPLDAASETRDIAAAIGELGEAAEGVDLSGVLDPSNLDADPLLDALDALRPQIQAKVADAFAAGGPEAARQTADGYVAQVVEALGGKLTAEEVTQLLGLTDLTATVQVALDMSTAARVRSMLDVLTGVAGTSPLTASIALALDAGTITPEAAEVLVRAQLGQAHVTLPTDVTPPTPESLQEAGAFVEAYAAADPPAIPTTADVAPATGVVDDWRGDVEDTTSTAPVDADVSDAEDEAQGFRRDTDRSRATVGVDANTALAAAILFAFISRPRATTIYVGTSGVPAVSSRLNELTQPRSVPIRAYLSDYPSAREIANRIGTVRVPVDAYLRSTPRISGNLDD